MNLRTIKRKSLEYYFLVSKELYNSKSRQTDIKLIKEAQSYYLEFLPLGLILELERQAVIETYTLLENQGKVVIAEEEAPEWLLLTDYWKAELKKNPDANGVIKTD